VALGPGIEQGLKILRLNLNTGTVHGQGHGTIKKCLTTFFGGGIGFKNLIILGFFLKIDEERRWRISERKEVKRLFSGQC
jgi:hypothetical protein